MRVYPNPHLNDENKFKEIMKKASQCLEECMVEKYNFVCSDSLPLYDMFQEEVLSHVEMDTRTIPEYKLTILQIMGIVAMEEDKKMPNISWKDVKKDNVIDFMKYKQLKNQRS